MTEHVIIELQINEGNLAVKEVQPTRFGKLFIDDKVLINEHNKSKLSKLVALAENSGVVKIEELQLKINGSLMQVDGMASSFKKNLITLFLYNVKNKLGDFLQQKLVPDLGVINHDLFMQIAETIDDVIWIRNDNEFLYVNSAFERVWGRKRE
ncbi:MAG: hypothetical protein MI922_25515, partial [Bacteroidales bacterium]|nr:hypothetical protein [Bacteroidales bacterium]